MKCQDITRIGCNLQMSDSVDVQSTKSKGIAINLARPLVTT